MNVSVSLTSAEPTALPGGFRFGAADQCNPNSPSKAGSSTANIRRADSRASSSGSGSTSAAARERRCGSIR